MPFDPEDFLDLAVSLASEPGEAERRSAISRAYYAVHLHARETLVTTGEINPTKTGTDHAVVISKLRARGGALGDQVDWLRVRRNRADYRLGSPVANQAPNVVAVARSIWPRI